MVLRGLDALTDAHRGAVVTIGNFDGVHLGHRKIIETVLDEARLLNAPTIAITFDPHPISVLNPANPPKLLTSSEDKASLIMSYGLDHVLLINFTLEFAGQEPDDFIRDVLIERLGARVVVVGGGYAFGMGKRGTTDLLRRRGRRHGYRVRVVRHAVSEGQPISSSRIRAKIAAGRVGRASELLGRPYSLVGTIVTGAGRGGPILKTPTANLSLPSEIVVPRRGVYAVRVLVDGVLWDGAANIGENPTFSTPGHASRESVEVHILGYSGSAVGKEVRVHFIERIRDEETFPSAEALRARIQEDIVRIRQILSRTDAGFLVSGVTC